MNLKQTLTLFIAGCLSVNVYAYTEEEMESIAVAILAAKNARVTATPNMQNASNSSAVSDNVDSTLDLALTRMKVNEQITPETTALFGDKVDLNTGAISFRHVDIALKGNSPLPVEIARTYRGSKGNFRNNLSFGDWLLEIPSINTMTLEYSRKAWNDNPERTLLSHIPNCGELPPMYADTGFATVEASRYWSGDTLDIPGVITQKLRRTSAAEMADGFGPRVADNWLVECLSDRYGFKATSPEGTVYTFDTIVLVPATHIYVEQESEILLPEYDYSVRMQLYTLSVQVSRVEDRFGNWVAYTYETATQTEHLPDNFIKYSNKLVKIESSDDRLIEIQYEEGATSERIKSIKADEKNWFYSYKTSYDEIELVNKDYLETVTRPDTKIWQFDLNFDRFGGFTINSPNDCQPTGSNITLSTITHPEGAIFKLTQQPKQFGRSRVGYSIERCFSNLAITKKELEFNQQKLTWGYSYSQNAGSPKRSTGATPPAEALSNLPFTPSGMNLMDLRSTTVNNPDGSKTVHVFNRSVTALEGTEVLTLYYDTDSSSLLKSVSSEFILEPKVGDVSFYSCKPAQYPLIKKDTCIDDGVISIFGNDAPQNNHVYPNLVETTLHHGTEKTVFRKIYNDYNAYGKPQLITETSVDGSRHIKQSYQHNIENWVFNLHTKTDMSEDENSWTTVSETSYYPADHAAKFLPETEKRFGTLLKTNTYHADGNIKRQTFNAENRWIEFNNYKRGIPQEIKLPGRYNASATQIATQEVKSNGEISSVTNFAGHPTSYIYDVMGRVQSITPPAPWAPTSIVYSNEGDRFIQTITRGSYQKRIEMDALFRPMLTHEKDNENNENIYIVQKFNAYNQPVFTSYPSNVDTASDGIATQYDGLQRIRRQYNTVDNLGIDYAYLQGNQKQVTDARGNITTTTYRAFGSPSQELPTKIEQPESVTTDISYNLFDNITTVVQNGITESRIYNAQQQLCRLVRPDVGHTAYKYNALGQPEWIAQGASGSAIICDESAVTAAQKVSYSYDNLGAQRTISYPDGTPEKTFTFDKQGNLIALVAGSAVWDYTYNSANLIETEVLTLDNISWMIDPVYNALGHVESVTYPSAKSISYAPNALGQATKVGDYVTGVTYYPNGQLKGYTYGNGLTYTQTLDSQQRPEYQTVKRSGTDLLNHFYQYDANHNIETIDDIITPAKNISLTYDALDRLDTATGFWGTGNFDYDGLGNIETKTLGSQSLSYLYDTKNRLTDITGSVSRSFGYDTRGNVTSNGARAFDFNLANQLVSSGTNSYQYDGYNRRVKKVSNGKTQLSLYNASGQLLMTDGDNGPTEYFYLGNKLIAKESQLPTNEDTPGYTGHLEDDDLQLTYMQARYYDPVIGRFYSNDPMGFKASNPMMFNRYAYANNNPYKFVDPDGNEAKSFFIENKSYENMSQAISNAWGDLSQSLNGDVQKGASNVADAVSEVTPSRETTHTVGNGASLLLAVGAVTTPCSAACATGSVLIDGAIAADHLSQGDVKSAALTMLPGALGETVSVAHKATKVGANVAEAGKRGAATNVMTNQAVGDTQDHKKIEKDN